MRWSISLWYETSLVSVCGHSSAAVGNVSSRSLSSPQQQLFYCSNSDLGTASEQKELSTILISLLILVFRRSL